jgi:hypothetical protein
MKFEKTSIPVIIGLEEIKQMIDKTKVDETYHISAIKPGIKCLIVNGSVCDENGDPFRNNLLQDKFAWMSERMQKSNFVAIGNIFFDSANARRSQSTNLFSLVNNNARWSNEIIDELVIELQDIHQPPHISGIKYSTRLQVLDGMSRFMDNNKRTVRPQSVFEGDKSNVEEIIEYVISNARLGNTTLFKNLSLEYVEGEQPEIRDFEADPYQIVKGLIVSTRSSESFVDIRAEVTSIVDFIRLKLGNRIYSLSFLNESKEVCAYIEDMIATGHIKLEEDYYYFKAIMKNGAPVGEIKRI